MRAGLPAIACTLACGLTASAAQQAGGTVLDLSVEGVVRSAAAYVKAYQEQLTFLIADEAYTQQICSQVPDNGGPKGRTMKSEPTRFRERYEEGVLSPAGGRTPREAAQARLENTSSHEEIVCEARYTNYRRFETTARIKKQS